MAQGFLINFNRSTENTLVYKLTSSQPYNIDFSLFQPELTAYKASLYQNSSLIFNNTINNPLSSFFNTSLNIQTPTTYNFQLELSTTNNTFLTSFNITVEAVSYFLSGDFIGFPGLYFTIPSGTLKELNFSNYTESPGIFFIGEGHTETIYLSAVNTTPNTTHYNWKINNSFSEFPIQTPTTQPHTSASVTLTSDTDTSSRLPVTLHLTDTVFTTSDPSFFRDDITGRPIYYPYYITTVDIVGNELPTNNTFRQSIQIKPYNGIEFVFNPGVGRTVLLPFNRSEANFQASLQTAIQGLGILSACYDKFGFIWKWSEFENCANKQFFTPAPSSWATVECSATFPKTWRGLTPTEINAGLLQAEDYSTNAILCSAITPPTWNLSTNRWSAPPVINTASNLFDYTLSLSDFGIELFTTSFQDDTNVTLGVQQTFTCQILVTDASQAPSYTINDWKPKTTILNPVHNFISVAPSNFKIYTPNRFVLTGENIWFQNLTTNQFFLTALEINFDDNKVLYLTGADLRASYFNISYDGIGFKTITAKSYIRGLGTPVVSRFPDIIQVLSEYDEVSPREYRSISDPLQLPWPNKPQVGINDWVTEDNINANIKKFYDNLKYLDSRGRVYTDTFSDYFGYLGVQPTVFGELTSCPLWTWEDLDCLNTSLPYTVTWRDVLTAASTFDTGEFAACGTWSQQQCDERDFNPVCFGKYNIFWQWKSLKASNSITQVTWRDTKCNGSERPKTWRYEPSVNVSLVPCDEGLWNVNIPKLDTFYDPIPQSIIQSRCIYAGVASRNNELYAAQKTLIKILSSDYNATLYTNKTTLDDVLRFSDIKNICLDSNNKIYVLDGILNQVVVYTYEPISIGDDWKLFIQWGGFGTAAAPNKFRNPNDLHVDQFDNVWVSDTGNNCVKLYTSGGSWLRTITDDELKQTPPLSLCVDSQTNIHILTKENIRVYSYNGEFIFSYTYNNLVTSEPRKLNSSHNREVIYLACESQVVKFFRNGIFYGFIIKQKQNVNNITGIYHDEYRNLLITTNDKILKFPDKMTILKLKGDLPEKYWSLEDLYIHKEEYIQNWVYTKAFQRLWDNIELFRNNLIYTEGFCKGYKPPKHFKDKILIGQNEIVTSTVVNRVFDNLWDNLQSVIEYFNPNCQEPFNP